MGFFADAYDLFSISLLTRLLGRIYYQARESFAFQSFACQSSRAQND